MEKMFLDIGLGNDFFDGTPKEQSTKINKWVNIKLKSCCTAKEIILRNEKATYRIGENI